jgi:hypothetical protein
MKKNLLLLAVLCLIPYTAFASYYGSWKINDYLTFTANTHDANTGLATDADSVPAYRIYEDETGTAILTGTMTFLDPTHTVGFYSERIDLSAANGFEKGKSYHIYVFAMVDSVNGTTSHNFQIEAETDSNVVSDKTGYSLGSSQTFNVTGNRTGNVSGSVGSVTGAVGSVTGNVGGNVAGNVNGSVASVSGSVSGSVGSVLGSVGSVAGNVDGNVTGVVGGLAAAAVDDICDEEVDNDGTAISLRGALKLMLSALTGKSDGGGTSTVTFRDLADSKDRITATVTGAGNRTAVTRDAD